MTTNAGDRGHLPPMSGPDLSELTGPVRLFTKVSGPDETGRVRLFKNGIMHLTKQGAKH